MRERFREARDRVTDLSGGYEAVYDALGATTSIEPDDDEDGLTDADVEAYAAEAHDDERVYVRDRDAPATSWVAASTDVAVRLWTTDAAIAPTGGDR